MFEKPSSGWADTTQIAELTASDAAASNPLVSVAISGDTIVAGAPLRTVGANADQGTI